MNSVNLLVQRLVKHPISLKYSTSSSLNSLFKNWGTPLCEKTLTVPSFGGSLTVKSPVDVHVKPAGTDEYPNLDRALVKLFSKTGHSPIVTSEDLADRTAVKIEQLSKNLKVEGKARTNPKDDALVVEVPMIHSVNVSVEKDAQVNVSDFLESEYCQISSEHGNVQATRIKTEAMTITTETGDINCSGHIQGTVKLHSADGNVIADQRFMGPSLDISTESGDIRVASSYADQSKFVTNTGHISLKNIHNESYIASYESGNVKVRGLDGSTNIFVKKGDVELHISKINQESRILVEDGDITVKMIDTHPVKITIDANQIIPDVKFQSLGKLEQRLDAPNTMHYSASIQPNVFSPALTIIAENGDVVLESQDWAASLGLKLAQPKYTHENLDV